MKLIALLDKWRWYPKRGAGGLARCFRKRDHLVQRHPHGQLPLVKTPTGTGGDSSRTRKSNNRSVMPLDVLGCTRATLKCTTSNGNAAS